MALKLSDYKTQVHNDWCPGCGDFGLLNAIQMALFELQITRDKAVVFSGIGCSGKTSQFTNVSGMHVPHGRLLTYAQGAKICNPELTIIGAAGDGDALGIGVGHFVAAGRRNVDITYLVFDNGVYGLTKGQASPTLKLGEKTKSIPNPNPNYDVNPIGLAISSGFTFVARSYSYSIRHLVDIIKKGITHKGLSLIQVLQPCPTYNDINTRDWYGGIDNVDEKTNKPIPRLYNLEETGYDPVVHYSSKAELDEKLTQALVRSLEWGKKIPIGVFYQNQIVSTYARRLRDLIPNYTENPPAKQKISSDDGKPITDVSKLLDSLEV